MFPLFQKYLNPQVRSSKLVNSFVYHLCLSILASGISSPYFLNSLGFHLSPECLFNFLWLVYSTICGKNFQFMVLTLENELNLCIFTHAPVIHSKLQVQFFENLFPPKGQEQRGGRQLCFIKVRSENMKMTWNISLYVVWFIIFLNAGADSGLVKSSDD